MNHLHPPFVAEVELEEKEGHIYAYSNDVPGLNICGEDRQYVLDDVIEAIKFLYQEVVGIRVDAEWAESPKSKFEMAPTQRPPVERVVMRELAAA